MKTKIIASSLAGLAILGGTVGFALSDASSAGAATKPAAATAPATVRGFLKAHRHALRHAGLDAAAKVLGMTPDALRAELKSGKSVAEVAQSKNISVADVENAGQGRRHQDRVVGLGRQAHAGQGHQDRGQGARRGRQGRQPRVRPEVDPHLTH